MLRIAVDAPSKRPISGERQGRKPALDEGLTIAITCNASLFTQVKAHFRIAMMAYSSENLLQVCKLVTFLRHWRTCDNFLAFRRQSCATYVDNDSQRIRRESTKKEVCAWELKPWLLSFKACLRREE